MRKDIKKVLENEYMKATSFGEKDGSFAQDAIALKRGVNYKVDSAEITEAVIGKSVIKKADGIYGLTQNRPILFDDRLMKGLSITARSILTNFKKARENGTLDLLKVINSLTHIECTNAAFVETPEFLAVKKEFNELLVDMQKNGTPKEREMVREGIVGFFETSKNNIIRGRKYFEGIKKYLQNSEEKEFFRAMFIAEMFDAKVFDFNFLEMTGEFDEMDLDIIEGIYRDSELLTPEEIEKVMLISRTFKSREEILEYYLNKDKKYYLTFATSEEIANAVIKGKISSREAIKKLRIKEIRMFSPELLEEFLSVPNFPKGTDFIDYVANGSKQERFLSKKLLSNLDRESFLKVALSDKIAENYKNPYASIDYVDEYGKLTSDDIIMLEKIGKINEEDVIKISKFESMKIQNPEEYNKMIQNLLDFYDFERLKNMTTSDKLNPKFAELYNNLIENLITEEQRKAYFEKMNRALENSENQDELVTAFYKKGLKVGKDINYVISEEYISERFLEDEFSEKELIELYELKLISIDTIRTLYSDSELIEQYRNGVLDYKILNLLTDKVDVIKQELEAQRLEENQLIDLYSKQDGLTIEEFLKITENYNFQSVNLVDYITDEITPEKISGLFENYYISQDELSVLVARKLITEEEAKEFASKIATHKEYESIFSLDNRFITLTRETDGENNGGGGFHEGHGTAVPKRLKNDPELQELLLSQIGFDDRTLTLKGTNNSLDGYRVYPSEDYGVMVFLKNDKPGNATYIMSVQQGLFFLNKIVREKRNSNGDGEVGVELQSDATKAELRETEFVKVRNAAAGWGANIVDAIKMLSPKFKEKLRTPSEYKKNIEEVIQEIKEDYRERKNNTDADGR